MPNGCVPCSSTTSRGHGIIVQTWLEILPQGHVPKFDIRWCCPIFLDDLEHPGILCPIEYYILTAGNFEVKYYFLKYMRFDGVVGYRICLTHRRSSVRAWVESYFVHLLPIGCCFGSKFRGYSSFELDSSKFEVLTVFSRLVFSRLALAGFTAASKSLSIWSFVAYYCL